MDPDFSILLNLAMQLICIWCFMLFSIAVRANCPKARLPSSFQGNDCAILVLSKRNRFPDLSPWLYRFWCHAGFQDPEYGWVMWRQIPHSSGGPCYGQWIVCQCKFTVAPLATSGAWFLILSLQNFLIIDESFTLSIYLPVTLLMLDSMSRRSSRGWSTAWQTPRSWSSPSSLARSSSPEPRCGRRYTEPLRTYTRCSCSSGNGSSTGKPLNPPLIYCCWLAFRPVFFFRLYHYLTRIPAVPNR